MVSVSFCDNPTCFQFTEKPIGRVYLFLKNILLAFKCILERCTRHILTTEKQPNSNVSCNMKIACIFYSCK